jgi:dihydroorotase
LFIQIPFDKKLNASGLVHEGKISTSLGLKGIPSLSEEISIRQQLAIAADLDCAIHFGGISTARSVELIREAKAKGQKVTCDVHIMNLMFTDEQLLNFNTNFKVMPPLRATADREALVGGLKENTIDAICSDHTPRDVESKVKEFQIADFGASTIETCFAMAVESLTGHLSISEIISKLAHSPRSILNLPAVSIEENQKAELTLFSTQPDHLSVFDVSETKSLSRNQPMHGKKQAAAIRCTINGLHLSGINQSLTV